MKQFDPDKCEELISKHEWLAASELLQSARADIVNSQGPTFDNLKPIMQYMKCDYSIRKGSQFLFLLESFRCLRNFSTKLENQNYLANYPNFLMETKTLFQSLLEDESEESRTLMKVLLQFLVNFIVANQEVSLRIVEILYDDLLECLHSKKNVFEIMALLYNIHLQNRHLGFNESLYREIFDLAVINSCEYIQFLAELFLYHENFWNYYDKLTTENRITVIELLKKLWIESKLDELPEIALHILSKNFSNSMDVIFQTKSSECESSEAYQVSLLLETLGCLCGNETYLKILQKDKELMIRSGVVLLNMHRLGKQSENYFTAVQKLSELKEPNECIQKHPTFGFKVGLVRLIGNLCWKKREMQDLVRETEIIPVLLDCCNIDARNPLIMQWVILAIRNLCDNNLENQNIIAGLQNEGTVSSALIEEMGLTLHNTEQREIRVVPLDLKR